MDLKFDALYWAVKIKMQWNEIEQAQRSHLHVR